MRPSRGIAAVLSGSAFAALTVMVRSENAFVRWERQSDRPGSGSARAWRTIARAGDKAPLLGLTALASGMALRQRRSPLPPAVVVATGVLLRARLAVSIDRPRPPSARWLVIPHGPSYPSRHVTWFCLGIGAVARQLPDPLRHASWPVVVASTAAVGYSRIRLGVHWPSDVLGAILLTATVHAAFDREWSQGKSP